MQLRSYIFPLYLTLLGNFVFSSNNPNSVLPDIIFDMGGILADTDSTKTLNTIWYEMLCHACSLHNPLKTKDRLFQILHELQPVGTSYAQELEPRDDEGRILPQQMRDWLSGTKTGLEILTQIKIDSAQHPEIFVNKTEQQLITAIITMMFVPELFVNTRALIPEGVALAQHCKKQGHRLYILSNWDAASFALMKTNYKEFFDLFDGIIISGTVGTIKPDPAIFNTLFTTYNLNPHHCIFIDDQTENIQTAKNLGLETIHIIKKTNLYKPWSRLPDFSNAHQQLKHATEKIRYKSILNAPVSVA